MWTAPPMTALQQASVLRRKTRATRESSDPRVMSPVKALRLSLARAADTLFGLALTVATVEQRRIEAGEIERALGAEGLFMLLDGTGGARGALRLDLALMAGMIEVQTIGQVLPGTVRPRPATRTDAAMVAPLIDAVLAGFDVEMAAGHHHRPSGFRYGDRVEDGRALALLLPAPEFDLFRITVDLEQGTRSGRLDLLLPPAPVGPSARAAGTVTPRRAESTSDLATIALAAPAVLEVVLARLNLPLRRAMALRPGDRLNLPHDSLATAQLLAPGGQTVAEGRLGQRDGWRALRLSGPATQAAPVRDAPQPLAESPG
ncbi:MAG: flagellar motor switch protein FliM [Alphaproteobacteria bacterium HGW-Alphaproteobacteria-1]|nr:MAG: flagellar motor switch protein FliM [Alphaproteobacteria bacterium HGW-Alphaproteobacteria-1]